VRSVSFEAFTPPTPPPSTTRALTRGNPSGPGGPASDGLKEPVSGGSADRKHEQKSIFAGGAARPSLEDAPCSTYPPLGKVMKLRKLTNTWEVGVVETVVHGLELMGEVRFSGGRLHEIELVWIMLWLEDSEVVDDDFAGSIAPLLARVIEGMGCTLLPGSSTPSVAAALAALAEGEGVSFRGPPGVNVFACLSGDGDGACTITLSRQKPDTGR
jgi:hypothetical protein